MFLSTVSLLSLTGFALLASAVAVRGIRTTSLPAGVTLTLLLTYLLVAAAAGWTRDEITTSLFAAAMVLFIGLMMNAMGWLRTCGGAQFAQFAAVCALWLGAPQVLTFVGLSALITAGLALLWLCLNRSSFKIPGVFAVSASAVALLPSSPWVMSVT